MGVFYGVRSPARANASVAALLNSIPRQTGLRGCRACSVRLRRPGVCCLFPQCSSLPSHRQNCTRLTPPSPPKTDFNHQKRPTPPDEGAGGGAARPRGKLLCPKSARNFGRVRWQVRLGPISPALSCSMNRWGLTRGLLRRADVSAAEGYPLPPHSAPMDSPPRTQDGPSASSSG